MREKERERERRYEKFYNFYTSAYLVASVSWQVRIPTSQKKYHPSSRHRELHNSSFEDVAFHTMTRLLMRIKVDSTRGSRWICRWHVDDEETVLATRCSP